MLQCISLTCGSWDSETDLGKGSTLLWLHLAELLSPGLNSMSNNMLHSSKKFSLEFCEYDTAIASVVMEAWRSLDVFCSAFC